MLPVCSTLVALTSLVGNPTRLPKARALKAIGTHTRLLVVAPHPDDAALGAGGLIARVARRHGKVHVVFMTSGDGYAPGVTLATHKAHPDPGDFRAYARRREHEAVAGLAALGVARGRVTFLGFPDRGLCPILVGFGADKPPYYRSPFTNVDRPRAAETTVSDTEYDVPDLERELAGLIAKIRPSIVVVPHRADRHPDHCASYLVVRDVLARLRTEHVTRRIALVEYLVHWDDWPPPGSGPAPPPSALASRTGWISFPLAPIERDAKRAAIERHRSQMQTMAGYLMSFVRARELFEVDGWSELSTRSVCCGG